MQNEKRAKPYTPAEFAALFGMHPTWGYRRIYDGAIKVLKGTPRSLIPQAEVDRFLSETEIHSFSKRPRRKRAQPTITNKPTRDIALSESGKDHEAQLQRRLPRT